MIRLANPPVVFRLAIYCEQVQIVRLIATGGSMVEVELAERSTNCGVPSKLRLTQLDAKVQILIVIYHHPMAGSASRSQFKLI
jgi:hypothetical protein